MTSSSSSSSSPFRSNCLQGQVALVTGGGSGICFEIARQLLRHGCRGVVLCGRRRAFLERAVQQLQQEHQHRNAIVRYCVCDVRSMEQCQQAVELCRTIFGRRQGGGRLDILVNGAAGNFLAQAHQLSSKGFATVLNIDALGTFNMSRAAYSLLKETAAMRNQNGQDDGGAVIINISATLQYGATWWQAHASSAKAAVDSLTRSLALEWGQDKIRVVGIAPGPIANTPGTIKLAPTTASAGLDNDNDGAAASAQIANSIPLQRMGETWEIGQAAVYLCTAKFVTGHVMVVDGGEWLYRKPWVPQELVAKLSRSLEASSRAQQPTTTRSKL